MTFDKQTRAIFRFTKNGQEPDFVRICSDQELELGDCWIGLSLANPSGLILAARVGKHTDALIEQLVNNAEGKFYLIKLNSALAYSFSYSSIIFGIC